MKFKSKYLIILFFVILFVPLHVFAMERVNLKVDKTDLEVGDEITVSAKLSSEIDAYALLATLKYDKNVFQRIEPSNFSVEDSFRISYNEDTNKFGIVNPSGKISTDKGTLFTVHLKVKEDANVGDTNIALTNISYSDGASKKTLDKVTTKVSVTRDAKEETIPSYQENKIQEDKEEVMETFSTMPIIIALGVLALILLIVLLSIYKKGNQKKKLLHGLIGIEAIVVCFVLFLFLTNINQKDVNHDGKKDYQDAEELIDYLIDMEGLHPKEDMSKQTDSKQKGTAFLLANDYDVNHDGRVDIEDAGDIASTVTKETKASLHAIEEDDAYYISKGKVTLKFKADIHPKGVTITKVKIGKQYYDVVYQKGVYSVLVEDYKKAGLHDFVISGVKFSNGEERSTHLTITKEVLKDVPKINISQQQLKQDDMALTFELEDHDHALESASIIIFKGEVTEEEIKEAKEGSGLLDQYDEEGNPIESDDWDKFEEVYEKRCNADAFPVQLNLKDTELELGGVYTVFVFGEYDLDSDSENQENAYQEEIMKDSPKTITVGKLTIHPSKSEKIYLSKKEEYQFDFTALFEPEEITESITQVIMDGEYKTVFLDNEDYAINLTAANSYGKKTFHISGVVLADGTRMFCDYDIEYEVLKDVPSISNFIYHKKDKQVTFTLDDPDKAFYKGTIKITDKENREILKETIDLKEKNVTFPVELQEKNTYHVVIHGDYDLDSDLENNRNQDAKTFEQQLKVFAVTLNAEKQIEYVEKGTETVSFNLNAKIEPESENTKLVKVNIQGKDLPVYLNEDGSYRVSVEVPQKEVAGKNNLEIRKVILDEDVNDENEIEEEVDATLPLEVEVLKDKPTLENFLIDETKSVPVVTFTLKDPDGAFEEKMGYVIVRDSLLEQKFPMEEAIDENGNVTIRLDQFEEGLEKGGVYQLDVQGNYDLDSDKKSIENKVKDQALIETHTFKIYKATLAQIRKDESKYANKNVALPFYITSSMNPEEALQAVVLEDGTTVPIEEIEEGYSILLNPESSCGEKTYTIQNVILQNDIEVKVKEPLKLQIDILKDTPYINKLNLNEENTLLSYELVDPDDAFSSGKIVLYDHSKQKVKSASIQKSGTISFDFKEEEVYYVQVIGSYNLDSKENDSNNEVVEEEMDYKSFIVGGDDNFTLTDVRITDAIQPFEKPVITFKSTNTKGNTIEKVSFTNDRTTLAPLEITKTDGETYEIMLSNASTSFGKHTVTLDSVSMNHTLKTFTNQKDYKVNTLTYTVLKEKPTIENLEVKNNRDYQNIQATFTLKDTYETTNQLTVVLVDSTGKIVASKEISKEELQKENLEVLLSYEKNTDGFYTVKVLADYALSDTYKYSHQSLAEKDILTTTEDDIYISQMSIEGDNLYPLKGKTDYKVIFTVHVGDKIKAIAPLKYGGRNYNQIQSITINGLNYPVDGMTGSTDTDYKVKATITVPDDAGVLKIKANRVQLGMSGYYNMTRTDMYSVPEKELVVDVLKDKPKIENLTITDSYDKDEATFNFDVVLDKTEQKENFKDGTIQLGNQIDTIQAGHNTITFTGIDKNKNLALTFTGSYDLDTDTLTETSDKNETKNGTLLKTEYGLYEQAVYEKIAITNAEAISEKGNHYFEKNEKIKLRFELSNLDPNLKAQPERVVIQDKTYRLTKTDDFYELVLDGYHSSGEKTLTLTDIILSNGKQVTLKDAYTFKPEVLKDVVTINKFSYEDLKDQVKVAFHLKDSDNARVGKAKVIITDENGEIVSESDYQDEIAWEKKEGIVRYFVQVVASFDRDIDKTKGSAHYEEQAILLDEVISLENNSMELKNIIDINLYKTKIEKDEETTTLIEEVSLQELKQNLDAYFVEVVLENMATVHARIKEVKNVDGHLLLLLNFQYVTQESQKEKETIQIDFGKIKENGQVANETHPKDAFKVLLEELETSDDVVLTHDYDASGVSTEGNTYVSKTLTGKLDGNGFKITNLSKPLYENIQGGTVENLKLENVTMPATNGNGAIAIKAVDAHLKNILVDNYQKSNAESQVGTLLGSSTNSQLENCKATRFSIVSGYANRQQIGGLVGSSTSTTIKNSYAKGSITGGWNFRAGLVGNTSGGTFEKNYTSVYLDGGMERGLICGIACGSGATFKNNISLNTGMIDYKVFQGAKESEKNYYLELASDPNTKPDNVTKVSSEEVTDDLFRKSLAFDSHNWNIKNTSTENLPTLQVEKTSCVSSKDHPDYDETKENLYSNLQKLMPFYDSNKIIDSAKNISDELLLNDVIVHIAPVDQQGGLVAYLTTEDAKKIRKIKVVFKSGAKREYSVSYDKIYDMLATYKINALGIDYTYQHYVIHSDSQVVNNLTNYLKGLDYTTNLDILTTNDDARIYRDFYQDTTQNELKEFVLKYLSNSNYTNTTNDDAINSYLEREVKQDKNIEKVLYVYNYFRRFYDLDIDGMKLYDFVLFNMQGFDDTLTPEKIAELYLSDSTGANFNTSVTNTVYNNLLSKYTDLKNLSSFLEYVVTHFSDLDMDKWTASQFKGILVEIPVDANPEVQYTLWDHLSHEDDEYKDTRYAVYNYILPILTLPETAAYIISAPAQFTIGAQRVYMGNPTDKDELATFKDKMKVYTDRIASYYNTAYSILQDPKLFNDIHLYQIDKRTTKTETGASVYNNPYTTEEPFHKNFDEVINVWPANYGVNAGNWGDRIEWNVAGFMDSDIKNDGNIDSGHPTWATWSHETAHYLDDRLFLKDYDRRFNSGGEDYADEFLMQKFGLGVVMNLSIHYNDDVEVATNLTPERINDKDKIWDFYQKMFESIYVVDYIEAQAFLKLTPEQKEQIGIQVSYPDEETYKNNPNEFYKARLVSGFNQRSASDWANMQLNSIDDLIKNKIVISPGVYKYSSRGDNKYGGEGINVAHWYQPNNPTGRPDSYALKWFSYEMLGYKGYDDGFVQYASNIDSKTYQNNGVTIKNYKSDDMAIAKISDGEYQTIDAYKKARFDQTSQNLKHLKYINVDEYAQKFYDALVEDAKAMKEAVEKRIQNGGGEEKCLGYYYCYTPLFNEDRGYPNSTKVRKELYFELKRKTQDFTDDIYSDSVNNEITFDIKTQD